MCDPNADLIIAGVRRLVSEQEQVERLRPRPDGLDQRGGSRLRIPVLSVRLEEQRRADPHRHRVLQLFGCGRRAERQHRGRSPVLLRDPERLLDRALLVRRDREAEQTRVDRLRVGGEGDPGPCLRNSLDADEDVQLRTRVFSGSNRERLPLTATVTGYRSPMYWTSSLFPSSACSGGRYARSTCLQTDGPEPALVTYALRPLRSTIRSPPCVRTGSRPTM